ncbi:HAMP domain-containing histidine kinase [Paenibacillus albidus]|uniref:sensor histidine kinase n=1 Tax=Paenibacillus albidus TaxID=2041023 RepID=UPI001BE89B11|nr:HAMP domain-containing sensor histidine kinase [Paenibacillus albidus]MBT2291166.1 HAMP domain-containing histidine kinase [Paenibacillus albidus]
MRTFLRIGLRLALFLLLLSVCVVAGWVVITTVLILLREVFPYLKKGNMSWTQTGVFLLLCLLALVLFIWSLTKPVSYMLTWLRQLAQGNYEEPVRTDWRGRPTAGDEIRVPYSFYQEIIGQLTLLTRVLRQAENERRERDENRKNWIAGVRHDLKTPLAYIRGYGSMIAAVQQYNWSAGEMAQFGALMEQKTIQVEQLIEDMNVSYQLDSGELPLHKELTEIVEFTRKIVTDLAEQTLAETFTFAFETNKEQQELVIDRRLLKRALHNLLWNAVVHNPAGSHIHMELRCRPQGVTMFIRDNGQGIPPDKLAHLNTGSKGEGLSAHTRINGSGLGIALARDFVEKHGGTVTIHSEQHQGTVVSVHLNDAAGFFT